MHLKNRRMRISYILFFLVPLGLGTKFYSGPWENWVHSFAGDIFYPMFWLFLIFFFRPEIRITKTAGMTFLGCVLIELTQLFSTPWLHFLRSSFIGRSLIGTHFVFMDIFYYGIGCILGAFIYHYIKQFEYQTKNDYKYNY